MARRSVLFTPGDRPEMMRKALDGVAEQSSAARETKSRDDSDVVVFDLEDAVAPGDREAARDAVDAVLAELDGGDRDGGDDDGGDGEEGGDRPEVWVRVNPVDGGPDGPSGAGVDDVAAVGGRADALVVPKVGDTTDLAAVQEAMRADGSEGSEGAEGGVGGDGGNAGDADGELPLVPILETASGVLWARAICATAGVTAAIFGAEDLAADVGASRTREGDEVLYGRQKVVAATAAAGVDAIDTLVTDFEDDERLREDAARSARWGFDGKLAIHPRQVGIINEAYTPPEDDVAWARQVLDAAADADGGVFEVDGEMIDAPLVRRAERIRERARAAGAW